MPPEKLDISGAYVDMRTRGKSNAEIAKLFGIKVESLNRRILRSDAAWIPEGPRIAEHGTSLAYLRDRCRCEVCRKANREAHYRWEASVTPADAKVHGSVSTYRNYGCRCTPCTQANTKTCREYHQNRRREAAR